ncbi:MAG: RNA methyltransferase [Actinomycetota bacterium]|nr:RNA methyltransferase [Actinomycetota bacterium]
MNSTSDAIQRVSDPDDPRLADYQGLRDVTLRRSLEAERGLFIAEGEKVIRRAVEAGYRPRSFLLSERWLPGLRDLLSGAAAPCLVVTEELAEQVTGFHVHRGALACMHRKPLPQPAELLKGAARVLVLEDLVEHTNVGAALRSAAALGIDAALLSPRCADPLYRRAVKVSMGAVFALPWTRVADWWEAVPQLTAAGFTTVALTPDPSAVDLAQVPIDRPIALLIGSEGPGLSSRWRCAADIRARIPMAAGVHSLNVAAAAAVACYALSDGRP